MTVFKAFLQVLNRCKVPIIMYTAFLIFFGGFNMRTSENSIGFTAERPTILIVNRDVNEGVTENLIVYLKENCDIADIADNEEARSDALFYRDVNYMIYIPENYREDFLGGKNPEIEIKSTGDYQSSLAEMMLSRYLRTAETYRNSTDDEEELLKKINDTLSDEAEIVLTSSLDTDKLAKVSFYFNFANYCILAGNIYVICLILSSFRSENIKKRTMVSSINYRKYNRILLLSNGLFSVVLWLFYMLLSFILLGKIMFTVHGCLFMLNAFVFTFCTLTLAFLFGNMANNKNAISGIVNVVALGTSFLCGAFVSMELLPDSVLAIAHVLPSYYYIKSNNLIASMEEFTPSTMQPVLINMGVIMLFSLFFIIITNIISRKRT